MRLLCIAGKAGQQGRVVVGRKVPTPDDLQRITKCRESTDQIMRWNRELIENGVCDVDADGAMVSRRLRRSARLREFGHRGGTKTAALASARNLRNEKGQYVTVQATAQAGSQAENQATSENKTQAPSTISHQPSSINHGNTAEPVVLTAEEHWGRIARLSEALGIDLTKLRNGHKFVEQLIEQEDAGFDFEQDILPACADARAAGKIPPDLSSLNYFRQRFEAKRAQRNVKAIASVPAASPDLTREDWIKALRAFILVGAWVRSEWGPSPIEPGCKAPDDLMVEAEVAWSRSGNHPRSAFHGNAMIAWAPEVSDFKTPAPFAARAA